MAEEISRGRREFERNAWEAGFTPRRADYFLYKTVEVVLGLSATPLLLAMLVWNWRTGLSPQARLLPLALFYLPSWLGWQATRRRWPVSLAFRHNLTLMLYLSPFLVTVPLLCIYYNSGHRAPGPHRHSSVAAEISWGGQIVILGSLVWFLVSRGNRFTKMAPFWDAAERRRAQSGILRGTFAHTCVLVAWVFCLKILGDPH